MAINTAAINATGTAILPSGTVSPIRVESPTDIRASKATFGLKLSKDLDVLAQSVNALISKLTSSTRTTPINAGGASEDIIVRNAAGTGTVTLHFIGGVYTGHT